MKSPQTSTQAGRPVHGSPGMAAAIADPVFVLALPRSFGSLVGTMLGQHPQMYALPETHLFLADTLRDWLDVCTRSSFDMAHGLLRVVAQLYFGEQTEEGIQFANAWLRRRQVFSTGYILELLAERAHPLVVVENSPSTVFHLASMQRARLMFPQAKFVHLIQHPRGYGDSIVAAVNEAASNGPVPEWLLQLAYYSPANSDQSEADIDPQRAWHALNLNIYRFLEGLPKSQRLNVRCEDVFASPRESLRIIADWLKLSTDDAAIEETQHPECSPYARFGPPSARYGNDPTFLQRPTVPAPAAIPVSLEGSVSWRCDGKGFSWEVRQLARQFGYE